MGFWKNLSSSWVRLINTGCTNNLSALEVIRIQVVNGAAILLTLTQVVLIAFRFLENDGFSFSNGLNLLVGLLIFPVVYLNKATYYRAAKSIFFLGGLVLITTICWNHAMQDQRTHTEIILLASSVFSVLLFDGIIMYISFIVVLLCYVFIVAVRLQVQHSEIKFSLDDLLNPVLAFFTVFVLTSLYRVAYDRSQRKLLELNNQKDKLFSIVSHDLKSPLNSLTGLLTMIEKGWITEQDFKQHLPGLSKKMQATTDLLTNLLLWARSQMKGEIQQMAKFDFAQIATSAIESVEGQATQKQISIENKVKSPAYVYADKNMIEVVLRNLLSNAIKFSHVQQSVILTASPSKGVLNVCVRDNGLGIEKKKAQTIFELKSISTSGTLDEKGTGLGLLLCKDFVEKNGGKIWVESEEGKGSSFYFAVPT